MRGYLSVVKIVLTPADAMGSWAIQARSVLEEVDVADLRPADIFPLGRSGLSEGIRGSIGLNVIHEEFIGAAFGWPTTTRKSLGDWLKESFRVKWRHGEPRITDSPLSIALRLLKDQVIRYGDIAVGARNMLVPNRQDVGSQCKWFDISDSLARNVKKLDSPYDTVWRDSLVFVGSGVENIKQHARHCDSLETQRKSLTDLIDRTLEVVDDYERSRQKKIPVTFTILKWTAISTLIGVAMSVTSSLSIGKVVGDLTLAIYLVTISASLGWGLSANGDLSDKRILRGLRPIKRASRDEQYLERRVQLAKSLCSVTNAYNKYLKQAADTLRSSCDKRQGFTEQGTFVSRGSDPLEHLRELGDYPGYVGPSERDAVGHCRKEEVEQKPMLGDVATNRLSVNEITSNLGLI